MNTRHRTPGDILKQYWGFTSFRPLQEDIISSITGGNDTLALLPTGGGKSVCYQVPALISEGTCLVISPLIALMQDQVSRLKELDIPAECIHSGMHYSDVQRVLDSTVHGAYKLLYVSPERLQTDTFRAYLAETEISFIAVDESHCVSQWGHDFRPDYLKIGDIREGMHKVPILALTATATPDVRQDIIYQLRMNNTRIFKQSFARHNLLYEVRYSENKNEDTLDDINKNCSIIYARSRRQVEQINKFLHDHAVAATAYHAGMDKEAREQSQQQWMDNESPVMVATTAFGMGIDKPDVRMVLHYDAPEHLEAYYQEAGRAGRDSHDAHALTFFNSTDIKRLHDSTAIQYPPEAYLRQVYQAVAEYLQVPIGAQPNQYYSFDLYDFSSKFSLQPREALPALNLLEREGLWTLTEAVYSPSTIQFTVERHVLDNLIQTHPDLAYVTTGLLRMYSTIFHYPTSVRESAIRKQLKMKQDELQQKLDQLHRMGLIEYSRRHEGPQLYFHHYRVDSRHLVIDLKRIDILRKRHQARTEAMIAYLDNTTECRERIILSYFGENPGKDCGHCDICKSRQVRDINLGHLRFELLHSIKRHGHIHVNMLVDNYPVGIRERALDIIRDMVDDGILALNDNGTVLLTGN